jgi:xanthine dehydrogenase accessory factor
MNTTELDRQTALWRRGEKRVAEALLVRTQHSSPRMPGARLRVNADGRMAGGVSMGCVENDLREHLLALLRGEREPGMCHYGRAFAESLEVGLSCGGEIDVWLRLVPDPLPAAPAGRSVRWIRLDAAGGEGFWRGGDAVPEGAEGLEEPLLRIWRGGGTWTGKDAAGTAWFLEEVAAPPRLFIVGASPVAVSLCTLATLAGWRVVIIDPRREYARAKQFPDAAEVIHRWPEEGLEAGGASEADAVAVLAHDAKLDLPGLAGALRAKCRYIGLLGSPGTQAHRREQLLAEGFSAEEVARIRGPIGLKSLGGVEPAEIAVSILAELIQFRRGKLGLEVML